MKETYPCSKCGRNHLKSSAVGRKHRKYEKTPTPTREPQVDLASTSEGRVLWASSAPGTVPRVQVAKVSEMTLREAAGFPEAPIPPKVTESKKKPREAVIDGNMTVNVGWEESGSEWEFPDDFSSYRDYYDAYRLIPKVNRAIKIKNWYMWQAGYELEGPETKKPNSDGDDGDEIDLVEVSDKILADINADVALGSRMTLWTQIFGNYYFRIVKGDNGTIFEPMNPMGMCLRREIKGKGPVTEYGYRSTSLANIEPIPKEEILHFKVNPDPWGVFGYGLVETVIDTVKKILYMKKYLPEIARQRSDPWLHFLIQDPRTKMPYDEETHKKVKNRIVSRQPGENIIDDGSITVEEVYQAAGVGGRQTIEGILAEFNADLTAGLGVPEIYLGFGSTTLKGTAEHQEVGFESEIRGLQMDVKRFMEQEVWELLGISPEVSLEWKPLKPEDKDALSMRLRAEVDKGFITKAYARQLLGHQEWGEMPQDPEEPEPVEPPEEPPEKPPKP